MIQKTIKEFRMMSESIGTQKNDVSPWGYLRRAEQQLLNTNPESIFYAALEMRFAIEARAREQFLSLEGIPKKTINMWHAEKIMLEMGRRINGARQPFTFHFKYKNRKIRPFTYIPLSKDILTNYGKLGNLLHLQRRCITPEFTKQRKKWLKDLLKEMTETCKGHMLKPPEWKVRCSKCKQYIPWDNIHKNNDQIICKCGHRGSLLGREMTMSIIVRKKSKRRIELLQAECINGEV